jgi:protein involved in polysaccharide export with SLBB domain
VSGEVKNPQEMPFKPKTTLGEAIKAAGGFGESADLRRVKLLRGNKALIYDLREIQPEGSNNPELQDGDLVIVPKIW